MTEHGGPDLGSPIMWDFSTNANPLPLPDRVLTTLRDCSRRPYPVPTAGSSEGIRRLTLAAWLSGIRTVWVPLPGYGDYADAARALGMAVCSYGMHGHELSACLLGPEALTPALIWVCDPGSPAGQGVSGDLMDRLAQLWRRPFGVAVAPWVLAIDRAYEPLRLAPVRTVWPESLVSRAWQLWSPNKALGLTGVRAGWMVAPTLLPASECGLGAIDQDAALLARVQKLAPSWVVSAEGVALLHTWVEPEVQAWLAAGCRQLLDWRESLRAQLQNWQWTVCPTDTSFMLATPPTAWQGHLPDLIHAWREAGIKLRDASSLGCPGSWRLSAQEPQALAVLARVCQNHFKRTQ
jgi:histidinol-phosphate aminotransferase